MKNSGRNDGQLSLDMLIGLTIFMLSFIFIAQYIPSIFVVERGDIALYPLAYRTASILAEDAGYWTNGTANGTDWENHYSEDVKIRAGLAVKPNVLSIDKIEALQKYYDTAGYEAVRAALGLYDPHETFDYNISLQLFRSNSSHPIYAMNDSQPLLLIGKPVPNYGDVVRYERIIAYDNATKIATISSKVDTPSTRTFTFDVTPPVTAFVIIIESRNVNTTNSTPWMKVWLNSNLIIDVRGDDETIGAFDITDEINSAGATQVKVRVHNVRGYVVMTNVGEYIGGRIGAKLVVCVW
ncbi:DUF7287 family protein [Archaeoglobus veneficus]|uniref:Uncharacterized protein n=1 Tax=Archaeoglobus veneficus (strain DSM 11195 / SNP6) TaxID=693661 RepID=F2KN51_ARCVS|nr:hypothetical protein [Archaeoglobus veneficus]AEA46152.1 hypothetical protein Arcve_0111 [Archaeoglobus veneficus SNP6]